MTYSGLSASGVGPAIICPARVVLPQSRTTGSYAERGNIIHAFLRVIALDSSPEVRERWLKSIADEKIRNTCAAIEIAEVLAGIDLIACERAYVLNVKDRTVRVVGDNIERKYNETLAAKGEAPLGKYDIPATMDIVGKNGDTYVEIDYKTGQHVGPIREHWQRRLCAVTLMLHYDESACESRIAYVHENGSIAVEADIFTAMDIDEFCDQCVKTIDTIAQFRVDFAAGKQLPVYPSDESCKYCGALTSCPYYVNLAKSINGDPQLQPDYKPITREEMGRAWKKMKEVERILANIEAAGKLMAEAEPLAVDDAWEVKPVWYPGRPHFDQAKARGKIMQLMQAMGSTDSEIHATLSSLSSKGADYAKFPMTKRKNK